MTLPSARLKAGCTHEVDTSHFEEAYDEDGEPYENWVASKRSLFEDIDAHRYWCPACGFVGYYSQAARDYFEKGVRCDLPGLDK